MGRAARLKRERRTNGVTPVADLLPLNPQQITLKNPAGEAGHFPAFIFGNAVTWEGLAMAAFEAAATPERFAALEAACDRMLRPEFITYFREEMVALGLDRLVVEPDSAKGQHLVLCGAGPSLADEAERYCRTGDQVWGCNSALPWLVDHGFAPTHGFAVDQTTAMLGEWASMPDVEYLLASTVHPHLAEFVVGRRRRLRFFHNYVGIKKPPVDVGGGVVLPYELWLYQAFFPPTIMTGSGLNAINRAIDLAVFMGFETITVLGADCAMRFRSLPPDAPPGTPEHTRWLEEEVVMHADGGHALASGATMLTLFGAVCVDPACDGSACTHEKRNWLTKPDMIISAVWLEMTRRQYFPYSADGLSEAEQLAERLAAPDRGRIKLVGDTLPVFLKDKPVAYLKRLPSLTDSTGKALPITNV